MTTRTTNAGQMAPVKVPHKRVYRSTELCQLAGCTYRQLDYWQRRGLLTLDGSQFTRGSGTPVRYGSLQVVLARAYAVVSAVARGLSTGGPTTGAGVTWDSRFASIPAQLVTAATEDPTLRDLWLYIEPDRAVIVRGDLATDGALSVDLYACASAVLQPEALAAS